MEEDRTIKIILILSVFTLILLITTISSCNINRRQKRLIQKEISSRMDLEAAIAKFKQERVGWDGDLKEYQKKFAEIEETLGATRRALAQEQLINSSLKDELEKVSKLKEALEEELEEALSGRSPRGRR